MNAQKLKAAISQVDSATDIPPETKKKLQETLNEAQAPIPDTTVYRWVVGSLGLVAIFTVLGAIWLCSQSAAAKMPEGVIALAAAAIGALAGLLAPQLKGG